MSEQMKRWALVTGASSGLGIEFARILASQGFDLVLAARREAPMEALGAELTARHGTEVVIEGIDLSEPDSANQLKQRLDARGIDLFVLINNAAFGLGAPFLDHDPDRLRRMLQLDIVTMTELSHVFGRSMAARGGGYILLVASVAAFQPTPLLAAYGAAKAYVLSLGEALNVELAPRTAVTVLSPGVMGTGFFEVSGYKLTRQMRQTMLPTAKVAQIGLDAMFARKSGVIAGRRNAVMAFASRLMPRHLLARLVYLMTK